MRFRKFLMAKIVSLVLVGTAWAGTGVGNLAKAIAKAEGFYRSGTKPARLHNPGDIRVPAGVRLPGMIGRDRYGYAIFKNDAAGWNALNHQLQKVIDGTSIYSVNMTLRDFSRHYATGKEWLWSVSKGLGVSPDTELWEVLGAAPQLLVVDRSPNF